MSANKPGKGMKVKTQEEIKTILDSVVSGKLNHLLKLEYEGQKDTELYNHVKEIKEADTDLAKALTIEKICKNCKFYLDNGRNTICESGKIINFDNWCYDKYGIQNYFQSHDHEVEMPQDSIYHFGAREAPYSCLTVMPEFGCIHWEPKI